MAVGWKECKGVEWLWEHVTCKQEMSLLLNIRPYLELQYSLCFPGNTYQENIFLVSHFYILIFIEK